jgi:hypothetical protein
MRLFRPGHPIEAVGSIVLKGIIRAVCVTTLLVVLRSNARSGKAAA